jgi:hypothetical protein
MDNEFMTDNELVLYAHEGKVPDRIRKVMEQDTVFHKGIHDPEKQKEIFLKYHQYQEGDEIPEAIDPDAALRRNLSILGIKDKEKQDAAIKKYRR